MKKQGIIFDMDLNVSNAITQLANANSSIGRNKK